MINEMINLMHLSGFIVQHQQSVLPLFIVLRVVENIHSRNIHMLCATDEFDLSLLFQSDQGKTDGNVIDHSWYVGSADSEKFSMQPEFWDVLINYQGVLFAENGSYMFQLFAEYNCSLQ